MKLRDCNPPTRLRLRSAGPAGACRPRRRRGRSIIDETGVEVVYRIKPDDPTSARLDLREAFLHRHAEAWDSFVEAQAALSSTPTEFLVEASLQVLEDGKPFFVKSWLERIPRHRV